MTRWLVLLFLVPVLLVPMLAGAAKDESDYPEGTMYRYTKPDGSTSMRSTLTQEAIHAGYEVLGPNGRVRETVAAAPPEEQEKRRAEKDAEREAAAQAQRDGELKRLYAGPEDAVRARERQLRALDLSIGYARNTLSQLEEKRDTEVAAAARAERAGRDVSENVQEAIDEYTRRMTHTREEIDGFEKDKEDVRAQYQPIIERLRELEDS